MDVGKILPHTELKNLMHILVKNNKLPQRTYFFELLFQKLFPLAILLNSHRNLNNGEIR